MESPGDKPRPSPYAPELIEKEIAHLKKRRSVRHGRDEARSLSHFLLFMAILGFFGIYALDPILYAYDRGEAIRVYLYLHNYGSDRKAAALAAAGFLSSYEIGRLDKQQGNFQNYCASSDDADRKADSLIRYAQGVRDLHNKNYAALSLLNKVRYTLFVKTGLTPPTRWEFLNPSIGS